MWVWRRMLKIPWMARRIIISIVNVIQEPVGLSVLCQRRILVRYFGYMTRKEVGNLEKVILFGKALAKRWRGRPPTKWFNIIKARMSSVVRLWFTGMGSWLTGHTFRCNTVVSDKRLKPTDDDDEFYFCTWLNYLLNHAFFISLMPKKMCDRGIELVFRQ